MSTAKPAASAAPASSEPRTQQEVIQRFKMLKMECQQLSQKIAELEMDANEHALVLNTLGGMDESRRCFRMVGGVLVERTVGEVLPALKTNREGITKVVAALSQQLRAKEKEHNALQQKFKIRPVEGSAGSALAGGSAGGDSSVTAGVLV